MKVSATKPFQIIYSLFQHEYLGYLFESYVVHVDSLGKLTFQHQNISPQNAEEFAKGLDDTDYELIDLMDSMSQNAIAKKFSKKPMKTFEFFLKVYDKQKGQEPLQQEIERYLEIKRAAVLEKMKGKRMFEMGNDGEPAWREIEVMENKATILFHFRKNEENTHYFPTIKYNDVKLDFQYKGAYIICKNPAWLVLAGKLYSFEKEVDGKKLLPFLNKKFIVIPKNVEETYYSKFVAPLIASFDVYAKGFEITSEDHRPQPIIKITGVNTNPTQESLFGKSNDIDDGSGFLVMEISFRYGQFIFKAEAPGPISVKMEKRDGDYVFHRVKRNLNFEKNTIKRLVESGMPFRHGRAALPKSKAISWLNRHKETLETKGLEFQQKESSGKEYFLGKSSIDIEVKENIDWFEVNAIIRFGEFEIPFRELRKYIINKKREFILPDGKIAVIPEEWFEEYSELFAFINDDSGTAQESRLKKHHLALVQELESGNLARVSMGKKLQKLRDFDQIENFPMPEGFQGTLRPYQTAGYNWMRFLDEYRFGGCLADDMGLGKTVQALALLQAQKETGKTGTSLLVMPTSLVYNWEMEAKKFTPDLKVFSYTGTFRDKDVSRFSQYDLVLTSYGIVRLDIEEIKSFYFNYVILDESQSIKNPSSIIAKSVRKLKSRQRLILTGTPLENSTLDLWSQMTFVNPGLLGNQAFFKNEFLVPIEKKNDFEKTKRLHTIIKPFILRRHKSQVARELPEKLENIHYCDMTEAQEKVYEEVKSHYRNKILGLIESDGIGKTQFVLLQGLTKLRQIANHPALTEEDYSDDSGKMEEILSMMDNALEEGHKILIFSQFVKHLKIVEKQVKEKSIKYAYLDGSTKDRKKEVEQFQNDPKTTVFLISLKAGGLGLNLTKADYVFILDPWWNPASEAQAVDRAHRIGQENKVFTYKFITRNTVEEKILALQQRKLRLANELIATEQSFVKSLTKEDIEGLLD